MSVPGIGVASGESRAANLATFWKRIDNAKTCKPLLQSHSVGVEWRDDSLWLDTRGVATAGITRQASPLE